MSSSSIPLAAPQVVYPRRRVVLMMLAAGWLVLNLGRTVISPTTVVGIPGYGPLDLGILGFGIYQAVLAAALLSVVVLQWRPLPLLWVDAAGQVWVRWLLFQRPEPITANRLRWSDARRGLEITRASGAVRLLPERALADPAGVRAWVQGLAGPSLSPSPTPVD